MNYTPERFFFSCRVYLRAQDISAGLNYRRRRRRGEKWKKKNQTESH